ncbi:hypothetical protein FF100_34795 [Methylobacterium terricola]|uniref:Uncharacterized protein n=1 Tax=Methylobacterium terricola TaxID=2583531 RepID=A0A5C4L6H9_9HYPH|nr:hypothetical protein [Methylobacterium terricola]TNC06267.1 hypothetical protein FF100_34795 [Methylobacterium terricola]
MAGRRLAASAIPTPGPWLVRGAAELGAPPPQAMLGVEPAAEDRPGGWPYFIRRDGPVEPGGCPLHIATGIQRLADARLIAAAPDLAATLLRLLTAPALGARDLDARTRDAIDAAWPLLIRVAPQLEIGS